MRCIFLPHRRKEYLWSAVATVDRAGLKKDRSCTKPDARRSYLHLCTNTVKVGTTGEHGNPKRHKIQLT